MGNKFYLYIFDISTVVSGVKSVISCITMIFYGTIHYSLLTVGGGKG